MTDTYMAGTFNEVKRMKRQITLRDPSLLLFFKPFPND